MSKPRLAHLVKVPKPYVPACATDIAKTIRAERRKLAAAEICKPLRVEPLIVDRIDSVIPWRKAK